MQPTWFVGPNIVCFLYDGIASVVYGTYLDDYLLYRCRNANGSQPPKTSINVNASSIFTSGLFHHIYISLSTT